MVQCPYCGFENDDNSDICFVCQEDLDSTYNVSMPEDKQEIKTEKLPLAHRYQNKKRKQRPKNQKNKLLSTILTIILPGLGHCYLGTYKEGILIIITYIITLALTTLESYVIVASLFIIAYSVVDVIIKTDKYNKGKTIESF